MAKRVIILEQSGTGIFRFALWATVSANRWFYYADPSKTSAFKQATGQEITDIQAGKVVELVDSISRAGANIAALQADLQQRWTDFQAQIDAVAWPGQRYGSLWDGTTWTVTNIQ